MRVLARFMDARNTAEGKFVSVLLSVLLVFSFLNVTMFTDRASAEDEVEQTLVEEPSDIPGEVQEENASEEVTPEETTNPVEEEVVTDEPSEAEQPYEGYAYVGNMVVKVTAAAGVVPAGTQVNVQRVTDAAVKEAVEDAVAEEGKSLEDYEAIDVTLTLDGEEIQPDGEVNVCIFDADLEGDDVTVYHVTDDASTVTEVPARQADANVQSFDTAHFSIYVVAAVDRMPVTYEFYNGGTLVDTQKIKAGEKLVSPESPVKTGSKFVGWEIDATNAMLDLNNPYLPVTEATTDEPTVTVHACFEEILYAYFMDRNGENVLWTESGTKSESIATASATSTINAYVQSSTEGFAGWYLDKACEEPLTEGSQFSEIEPIKLYPKVVEGYWVTFDSNGGKGVDPFFIAGDKTNVAGYNEDAFQTEMIGYDFLGWFADGADDPEDFAKLPEGPLELTAQWAPKTTIGYTIQYWIENADDDGYTYANSQHLDNGTAGAGVEIISGNDVSKYINNAGVLPNAGDKGQFSYDSRKTAEENADIRINGDGSTIFNAYFTRNTYMLIFTEGKTTYVCDKTEHTHNHGGWFGTSCYDWLGNLTCKKPEHKHSSECLGGSIYSARVKYDADLAGVWEKVWEKKPKSSWKSSLTGNYYTYLQKMPASDLTMTYNKTGDSYSWYYYVESLDGKAPNGEKTLNKDGKTYYLWMTSYAPTNVSLTYAEDYFPITGFTQAVASWGFGKTPTTDGSKLLYNRNSYSLQFNNGAAIVKTETVSYQKSLDSYLNGFKTPEAPEGKSDYTFGGWYLDPACSDKVTEGITMPATNVVVYAKWNAPEVSVTVYGADNDTTTIPVVANYNKALSADDIQKMNKTAQENTPAGKKFIGWVYEDGKPFNVDTVITRSITLKPFYVTISATQGSRVQYLQQNGTTASATEDQNSYVEGAYAKLLPCADEAPAGQVFQGWLVGETLYQPGAKIPMGSEDAQAIAQYGLVPPTTALTLYDNQGNEFAWEQNNVAALMNNTTLNVPTLAAADFTAPENSTFIGWTEAEHPTLEVLDADKVYQPNTKVGIDGVDGNKLYAQYVQLEATGYTAKYDGESHEGVSDVKLKLFGTNLELNADMYTVEYKKAAATKWTTTVPEFKNASEYTVNVRATVFNKIEVEGTVTVAISKRDVTLTSGGGEKPYDGTALTNSTVNVAGDGFVTGEGATYNVTGSQTLVGDSENTFAYTLKDNTEPDNYNITKTAGILKVVDRAEKYKVEVTGKSATATYDGEAHSVSGFINGVNVANETLNKIVEVEIGGTPAVKVEADNNIYYVMGLTSSRVETNADVYYTSIAGKAIVLDAKGNDVSSQFVVTAKPGTLTIKAGDSNTVVVPGYEDENGVQSKGARKVYDGQALKLEDVKAAMPGSTLLYSENGAEGTWSEAAPTRTDAGETTVFVKATNPNYKDTPVVEAKLVVDKRPVLVSGETWGDEAQPYIPEGYSSDKFAAEKAAEGSDRGLLAGHELSGLSYSISGTDAGATYKGAFEGKAAVKAGEVDVTGNYSVALASGTLTIKAGDSNTVVVPGYEDENGVQSKGARKVYDGQALKLEDVKAAMPGSTLLYSENGAEGTWSEAAPTRTDAGETTVFVKATNPNYKDTPVVEAKLVVDKRDIELTGKSATVIYNGEEQSVDGYDVTAGELVANQEIKASHVAKGTNAGSHAGQFKKTETDNYDIQILGDNLDVTKNYKIKVVSGVLTVVAQSINPEDPTEIDPDDPNQPVYVGIQVSELVDVVYNGVAQKQAPEVKDADGNALTEDDYELDWTDAVDAGTVTVTVTGKGNYTGTVTRTYRIAPAPLTVTTPSDTKTFDGVALTGGQATLTGLVNGETATAYATGVQLTVGAATNGYRIEWDTAKASNYTIIERLGTLTVNAAPPAAPVTPAVPTPPVPATPAAVVPAAPAVIPAPAAPAPAAPAVTPIADNPTPAAPAPAPTETIQDDPTPQAASATIADEDVPLGAFDEPHCWVHWVMLVGILLTAAYGIVVVRRRLGIANEVTALENEVRGIADANGETVPVAGHQAL